MVLNTMKSVFKRTSYPMRRHEYAPGGVFAEPARAKRAHPLRAAQPPEPSAVHSLGSASGSERAGVNPVPAAVLGLTDAEAGTWTGLRGIAAWAEETQEGAAASVHLEDCELAALEPGLQAEPLPPAEEPDQAGSSSERRRRVILDSDDQDARPVRLADAFGTDAPGAGLEPDLDSVEGTNPLSTQLEPVLESPIAAIRHSAAHAPCAQEARDSLHAEPAAHVRAPVDSAAGQQLARAPATVAQQAGEPFLEGVAQQMPGHQVQGRRRTEAERLRPFYFDECAYAFQCHVGLL